MKQIEFILITFFIVFILGMHSSISLCSAQDHIWIEKSSMPDIRWGHSSCELNGKVYVLGGMNVFAFPTVPLNTVLMYDPLLDTCITKANMELVRTGFSTCVYNGKIYAIGGAQQIYGSPTLTTKSIDAYDPEKDSWTHITDMPVSRYDHTASLVGSKIYIIGGYDDPSKHPFSQVDIYDLEAESWTTGAYMPTPRVQLSAVVLNDKIYTIGGQRGLSTNESGERTVEVYDPATDTWTSVADMLTKRKMMSACTLDGNIYVFGGAEGYCTSSLSGIQVYIPETESWIKIGDMPKGIVLQTSTFVDNKIYITGGVNGNCTTYNILSTIYEFVPDQAALSLNEYYLKDGISIFPNPSDKIINVKIENSGNASVEIYNLSGSLLYSQIISSKIDKIDISSLTTGIYLFKVKQNNRNYIEKLVVR